MTHTQIKKNTEIYVCNQLKFDAFAREIAQHLDHEVVIKLAVNYLKKYKNAHFMLTFYRLELLLCFVYFFECSVYKQSLYDIRISCEFNIVGKCLIPF